VIELADIEAAAQRLGGVAHLTPVVTSRTLDERTHAKVHLKAENLQRIGAFKFRGAYNAIASLSDEERAQGVAAVSSGNHAQAVALAARLLGSHATILMPEDAPPNKRAATEGYGAEVVSFDRYAVQRDELLDELVETRGLVAVHPYEDPRVQAGQGTLALELLQQAGALDAVMVPIGGGGLISGVATAVKGLRPSARVIGVEPETSAAMKLAVEAGKPVPLTPVSLADGLNAPFAGTHALAVVRERVDELVLVTEAELEDAFRFLYGRAKLAVEGAGAAATAALLAGKIPHEQGEHVALVVSGGNVAPKTASAILASR
jgi:threo-3-hydroxy-L-aspartate ammonia-lyase